MQIERTFTLDAPLKRAWDFLNEPQEVGACLPGCHTVEILEPGKYRASVGIKVGPIKVGFDVQVENTEERPPEFAAYTMRGADKDGGSKVSAQCTLALKAIDATHTEISYASNVQIVGKLGKFSGGVMQKFADGINDQFISALKKRLLEYEKNFADDAAPGAASAAAAGSDQGTRTRLARFLDWLRRYL